MAFGLSIVNGVGIFSLFIFAAVGVLVFTYSLLGLLAAVTLQWTFHLVGVFFPVSSDPSAWFSGESAVAFVLAMLPAAWRAWVSAGRPAAPAG